MLPMVAFRALQTATFWSGIVRYLRNRRTYRALPEAEPIPWREAQPQLKDRLPTSPFDPHYFYQDVWAARHVAAAAPERHVDVGSRVDYVGFLTAICDVTFVDIRPLEAELDRLETIGASILALPYADRSLESVSCLHVVEHIGLGRYGDPLDPLGSVKAAAELQRVVAPGGQLLFSGPIGVPRVAFDAHRVQDPRTIVSWFGELELAEFAGVDDAGRFSRDHSINDLARSRYACGLFRFVRPAS